MAYSDHTAAFSGSKNLGVQVGHNSGQIYNQLYPNTEQPEVAPAPSPNIPFRRDPDFVDHGTIVADLHLKCAAPASRIALVGLGGVGKSQLAIEFGHQIREASSETWVFWVFAGSTERFDKSYRDIADQVKVPGRTAPNADVLKLVYDYLSDERNGKWLLILDNADDARILPENAHVGQTAANNSSKIGHKNLLRDCLPQSQNGRIVITTRSESVALSLVERSEIIKVQPMARSDALALFKKKLGMAENEEDVIKLAELLEFMPLAITQAAAYISQRAPRCSIRQYLEDFSRNDQQKDSLLDYKAGYLRRDEGAKNSIINTWQISFNHIRDTRPSAADLLSLMSFFDRQGIPESLLRGKSNEVDKVSAGAEFHKHSSSNFSENKKFDEDVQVLRDYCFISVDTAETFEMHALVQLATRQWLKANDTLEVWKEQFIKNLSAQFPTGDFENWTICQALFPHVKSALTQRPVKRASLLKWSFLIYKAGCYSRRNGSIHEAISMLTLSMEVDLETLGQEHDHTICVSALADAYRVDGQLNRAEKLQVEVLKVHQRLSGGEHSSTLFSMYNLGLTYLEMERCEDAEVLMLQASELASRILGKEHPGALTIMHALASIYCKQRRWRDAEELESQTLKLIKRVLGEEHPNVLTIMELLASTFVKQGRWKDAEELGSQTLKLRKRVLGEKHPETLTSTGNLALIYWKQDRYEEAEELELQTLKLKRKVLGEKHPETLTGMNNLAMTLKSLCRDEEALSLMEDCVNLRKQVLGPQHPDTKDSLEWLQSWKEEKEEGEVRK